MRSERTRARLGRVLVAVAAVAALVLSAGVSPAGHLNDRTAKLDLIDRLQVAPQTVILGSSRARRAAPKYLQQLTGRTGFNAAVISGNAADAWVMTRYLADCFPNHRPAYLWFVEVGVGTNGVNPDLRADPRSYAYLHSADTSVRRRVCGPGDHTARVLYNPDGSLGPESVRNLPEHAQHLAQKVAALVAEVRSGPGGPPGRVDPLRYIWFEKALRFMNARGARPVIVLNPIYPTVLAELKKKGFPARVVADRYFAEAHKRFNFVVVDGEDIHRWGGSTLDFADPTHINERNTQRLLRYVVAHSDGALR